MTLPLSGRFAPALVVLLLAALVPTIMHGYLGLTEDDGRRAAEFSGLALDQVRPTAVTPRTPDWAERRFATRDWFERTYSTPDGDVRLSIVRTFDAKRVYHHPELALMHGTDFQVSGVEALPWQPDVTVHVLRGNGAGAGAIALYALHYKDGFVADPVRFQFRASAEMLFGGREPMTLIFVSGNDQGGADVGGTWAAQILHAAVVKFLAA